jgi:hypothetical protein
MTPTHRWWVFALVCLALFMGALDSLVVTTALPAIGRALHARLSDLEWRSMPIPSSSPSA